MADQTLQHFKSEFANEIFVARAEQDYLLARFCKLNGLDRNFYWLAAQAIEKLMKACLVCNDVSTRGLGHDLPELLSAYSKTYGDVAIRSFRKLDDVHDKFWRNESIEDFCRRVDRQGHPDSRYVSHPGR